MSQWYARAVLAVADAERALGFYVGQLGFKEDWRFEETGKASVVQVSRLGCELILSAQWPEGRGRGVMFVSLDPEVLDALRIELGAKGVDVEDGWWGYHVMILRDPDGNRLLFPYPNPPVAEGKA